MALITVVVPLYNTEEYLRRCVTSILEQSFDDFNLVLVDDGSQDESPAICDQYERENPKVRVIHQSNRGLSAARNTGIEWALGESDCQYITFIDSDDWVHARYLELLYSAMQDSRCGVAVGKYVKTSETMILGDSSQSKSVMMRPGDFYCSNTTNFTVAWGKLFRIGDFAELRFPEGKIHEDEFVTWKIMFKYDHVMFIDCPLYAYFQWNGSITHSPWKIEYMSCLEALEEQKLWFEEHGNDGMKRRFMEKFTAIYATQVRGLESIDADKKLIRTHRKRMKQHLKNSRNYLPFRKHYKIYRTAWPMISRIMWFIYRVCGKVAQILKDLKSGA